MALHFPVFSNRFGFINKAFLFPELMTSKTIFFKWHSTYQFSEIDLEI